MKFNLILFFLSSTRRLIFNLKTPTNQSGVVHLEYLDQSKPALLPNELTSLDTIRALFVQSYQGLLTMPMLEPHKGYGIMMKNRNNGNFEPVDSVRLGDFFLFNVNYKCIGIYCVATNI